MCELRGVVRVFVHALCLRFSGAWKGRHHHVAAHTLRNSLTEKEAPWQLFRDLSIWCFNCLGTEGDREVPWKVPE